MLEFAHEPSNATSCGSLARQVASNVSPRTRRYASRRAARWRLCEADEGICRELVRRGLASALVEAVDGAATSRSGAWWPAHRDDAVRTDVLRVGTRIAMSVSDERGVISVGAALGAACSSARGRWLPLKSGAFVCGE